MPGSIITKAKEHIPVKAQCGVIGCILHVADIDIQIVILLHLGNASVHFIQKSLLLVREVFNIHEIHGRYPRSPVPYGNFEPFLLKLFLPHQCEIAAWIHLFVYNIKVYPLILTRAYRQKSLFIPYKRNGLISHLFCEGFMLTAAHNAYGIL